MLNNKNKIILIYPGPIGLYLKERLPSLLLDRKIVQRLFNSALKRRVVLPLSTLGLVPYLKKEGFEVIHIDGRVENSLEILARELDERVLFVGVSALTGNMIRYGLLCSKYVRNRKPTIPIVWGGVHVTLATEQSLMTSKLVDIVVRGEGEETVVELAKTLRDGKNLTSVLGVSYKRDGIIYHNDDRPFVDFDKILDIDYDVLSLENYDTKDNLLYQSERGCPHRCAFCDVVIVHRKKTRKKSAKRVLDDFEKLAKKFKPNKIHLVDDCFFADLKWAGEIIEGIIRRKINVNWHASCRAQYFRRTNVDFWKRAKEAGLIEVYVGVESGSQKMLDSMKKDCTLEDIYNAVEQTTKADILFITNFLSGLPGEAKEDVIKTIEMIDFLRETYGNKILIGTIILYAPCPGTPLHYDTIKEGFSPPSALAEWGEFIIGDRTHTSWHPLVDYFSAVTLCAKWGHKFDLKKSFKRLRRFNIPGIMLDVLGHGAYRRWKNRKFKYSYDLKMIRGLHRFFYEWRGT